MKQSLKIAVCGSVLVGLLGCGRVNNSTSGGTASTQQYNQLVDKYNTLLKISQAQSEIAKVTNEAYSAQVKSLEELKSELAKSHQALLDSSHSLENASTKEEVDLMVLDLVLGTYSSAMDIMHQTYLSEQTLTDGDIESLNNALATISDIRTKVHTQLASLEIRILEQAAAIDANGIQVYKDAAKNQEARNNQRKSNGLSESIAGRSKTLSGIRKLLEVDAKGVELQVKRIAAASKNANTALPRGGSNQGAKPTAPVVPAAKSKPSIALSPRDQAVVKNVPVGSAGFVPAAGGSVSPLRTKDDVIAYGTANNFKDGAAKSASEMTSATGGMVAFASQPKQIPQAISDILSTIKPKLNTNNDALEVAFLIDYSGSMNDDIDAVVNGLVDIVKNLKNVNVTGRTVKIGLVLFGARGAQTRELDLTSDTVKVQTELKRILAQYKTKSHSEPVGEASYGGLKLAAEQLSWTSKNRAAILITDEPSSEIEAGETDYINSVNQLLKKSGIDTTIYTIIVK